MQKLAIIAENKVVQLVRGVSTISAHGRKGLVTPAVKQSMAGTGPLISHCANPLWGLANHCISVPWLPHLRILLLVCSSYLLLIMQFSIDYSNI